MPPTRVRDAHSWLALANLAARGSRSRDERPASRDPPAEDSFAAARQIFRRGLEHCPNSVHLLQAFGVLEHRAGDRDAARELFARGLVVDPNNPYVCQAWGLLEQRVGNKDQARKLFESSVSHRANPEVFWKLGSAGGERGEY